MFHYIKEKTLGENYKEAYKLWRERNPMMRMNMDAKGLLNQKNYILKTKRLTDVEVDEIKENTRLKLEDDKDDRTKEVIGDKMDTHVIENQKRDQEYNNTGSDTIENNKHPKAEGEQNRDRNKLKEDLQITWHKVRLLHMSEREKLPKLTKNSKVTNFQEEINGIIEELLEEQEVDITDINNLIYAAATIMTLTLNKFNKRDK